MRGLGEAGEFRGRDKSDVLRAPPVDDDGLFLRGDGVAERRQPGASGCVRHFGSQLEFILYRNSVQNREAVSSPRTPLLELVSQ